jgi:hypothetical protein
MHNGMERAAMRVREVQLRGRSRRHSIAAPPSRQQGHLHLRLALSSCPQGSIDSLASSIEQTLHLLTYPATRPPP